jgi:hypothetical protein
MFRWKKWAGLMGVAVLVVVLVALVATAGTTGTTGVTPVADDEGTQVQGGASGCSQYKNDFVPCGSAKCLGQSMKCPTQNRLSSGSGVSAKNAQDTNGRCFICGAYCSNGTLSITTWEACR